MAASAIFRLAPASDTRAFGFLVSLALHAGVLAAYGLWSQSLRLLPERREEPVTVTIMALPSLETEQPSVLRPKAAPRPANQVTTTNTTPASPERQGARPAPDSAVSDPPGLAPPVGASTMDRRTVVGGRGRA